MKKILITIVAGLQILACYSQGNTSLPSGSLTTTINGKPWKSKSVVALYDAKNDYISFNFEDDVSAITVTIRTLKKEIAPNMPYQDMIQGEFKAGYASDLIFFGTYFPDKKLSQNPVNGYTMIKAEFAIDELDLTKKTIKIAFQMTAGKATKSFNLMKPNEKDLEKVEIKNAESSTVTFVSY